MKKVALLIASSFLLSGCATMQNKEIGTIIGGVAGVALGSALGGDSRSAQRNSMLIGALVGSLVGRHIGSHFDEREQRTIADARERALESARLPEPIQGKSGAVYSIEAIQPEPQAEPQAEPEFKPATVPATTAEHVPQKELAPSQSRQAAKISTPRPVPETTRQPAKIIRTASTPIMGECRTVKQKIALPDGRVIVDTARFCKQPPEPGKWIEA